MRWFGRRRIKKNTDTGNPPSVNRVFGILWLGNLHYPQQYGIDITQELRKFYQLFYHVDIDSEKATEILGQ